MIAAVNAWEENVVIPTYPIGSPEKNPMFLEKRVYQGSSGVVYPHPVIEKISDEKINQTYRAVYLENEYLKIMILPELGGRIQMAFDKVKQRHFVYYNQVIKPALVGLTGPWISGGIEFNWPQHHRPSTFEAVDFTITENADGSKTVWVNEVERMFRTKGMAGFTLYPGKAYLEISGKLYNRTPFPQTFLWWANPAVKVNDDYQSVFPPDVNAVFDHGKRDVSSFPIAKGVYYKVDYSPGIDISRYKNIPVPTSYMAVKSNYNFMGGYEHDSKGGLLHVADHHVVPGKKQWTWGHGEFGQAWDRNLTDEDGPYIELMTGAFTDNQPDFSWMQPYEEKKFTQYFMPYQQVGMVKNATKEAAVNIEFEGKVASIKLYTTSKYDQVRISLVKGSTVLYEETIATSPADPYANQIFFDDPIAPEDVKLVITDVSSKRELVSYQVEKLVDQEIPAPAVAAKRPQDVENNEQLFLTGQHLEQYRHATYMATDYYEEALRRDPKDARNNNALGAWYLKRGQFEKSINYFSSAIKTITQRNPNPYDGEAYYNLGFAYKMMDRLDDAYDAFYKCVWNGAWQHAGYFNLARISCLRKDFEKALEFANESLVKNYNSHSVRHLKALILRKLNKKKEAAKIIEKSLALDPFNFGCLFEKYLLLKYSYNDEAERTLYQLKVTSRNWVHNFIEYALDYAQAGMYNEAIEFLSLCTESQNQTVYTLVPYYLGWFSKQSGDIEQAKTYFKEGASLSADFIFSNRVEDVPVLTSAIELNPSDANAWYYLGNFWYDKRQYTEAINCWETSVTINAKFPTAHRNLSLAYCNKLKDPAKALLSLEKAFQLDRKDARVKMELDQLYKKLNKSPKERLTFLEEDIELINERTDLYLERITLLNQTGNFQKAKDLIAKQIFHPWEGGEGKVIGQYLVSHISLAKQAIDNGKYQEAIDLLSQAENYPLNLGEGKLYGTQENDIHYWKGVAYEMLGSKSLSEQFYQRAVQGISEPVQAIFYNDPQPDKIFYQGLAWLKLNQPTKATQIFKRLIEFGEQHLNDNIHIDYFAVSLPDLLVFDVDLDLRNKIHCLYLIGLGYLGLGNSHLEKAEQCFDEVLKLDANHQGASIHQRMLNYSVITEK